MKIVLLAVFVLTVAPASAGTVMFGAVYSDGRATPQRSIDVPDAWIDAGVRACGQQGTFISCRRWVDAVLAYEARLGGR